MEGSTVTQSDGWQSPYDPPQQNTPGPSPDPTSDPTPPPERTPDQAAAPNPYQQPYQQQPAAPQPYQQGPGYPPAPYPPAPYQSAPYEQGSVYQPGPYQPGPYQPGPYQGPYQAQPAQYGAPYGYPTPPEKNALGVWSLVLGILSIVMLFSCFVGFLAAIPAVITGHLARKAQKEGLADNAGLALGGIITGWVTIGLTVLAAAGIAILFSIPEFREGFFSDSSSTYTDY